MIQERRAKAISLLLADPSHAARIAALHHIVFRSRTDASEIEKLLSDPTSLGLIATADGAKTLVGYLLGRVVGEDAEILWVGVDGLWRNNGIGLKLIEGFNRAAANVQAKRVVFEVAVDNVAALRLYQRAGFQQVASREKYYDRGDVQVDAAVLATALPAIAT